jgi:predicted MPP superfamily phosphohydrolase
MTPRILQFAIFVSIVISILGGLHYYLWARLLRDTAMPAAAMRAGTLLVVFLGLSIPAAFVFGRVGLGRPLVWLAYVWMGLMFFLFVALLGTDVAYLVARVTGPIDLERRTALRRILAGVAGLVAFSAAGAGLFEALRRLRVVEVSVPLKRLPRELDGFTIVQVSDIHVGPTIGRGFIEGIVERVNSLAPDLVAITGDLVDGSVARLGASVAPIAQLESKHGTFFVTGNHEYYSGAEEWVAELGRLGVRVLRNERVSVERDGHGFELVGVDDFHARGQAPGHGADLRRALDGYDRSRESVLLAHQPRQAIEAAELGVGLQLSGHTHGGQLWPFTYLVRLQQPFIAGLDKLGELFIYTSRGTGYWGPPMRVGAPAEITRITLRAAAADHIAKQSA